MPFAGYKDFADCENQNKDKGDTGAYCGAIQNKVEEVNGSDWTNMTQEQRRNAILAGNVNLEEDNSLHLIAGSTTEGVLDFNEDRDGGATGKRAEDVSNRLIIMK